MAYEQLQSETKIRLYQVYRLNYIEPDWRNRPRINARGNLIIYLWTMVGFLKEHRFEDPPA
jgi:hypothetical protein